MLPRSASDRTSLYLQHVKPRRVPTPSERCIRTVPYTLQDCCTHSMTVLYVHRSSGTDLSAFPYLPLGGQPTSGLLEKGDQSYEGVLRGTRATPDPPSGILTLHGWILGLAVAVCVPGLLARSSPAFTCSGVCECSRLIYLASL